MRNTIVCGFEVMSTSWGEEVEDKFSYWADPPHVLLGCWPPDRTGVVHIQMCLQLWADTVAAGLQDKCHRVTFRLLHQNSQTCFPVLLLEFSKTGDMHADLFMELRDANVAATCEQNIEGVHALIHQVCQNAGRNPLPPLCCAYVRHPQNSRELEDWRVHTFAVHQWHRKQTSALLAGMFSDEFSKRAGCVAVLHFSLGYI